jgi:hypothetical protein
LQLENEAETICELKMYFLPELEVLELEPNDGKLFAKCKDLAWEKCLETMPFMLDAQKIIQKKIRIHLFSWEAQVTMSPI